MLSLIKKFIRNQIVYPVIDVFFPPLCHFCEDRLSPDIKIICKKCWAEIPLFKGHLDQSLKDRSFDNLFILFEFEDTIRQLIHLLKYRRYLSLTENFALEAVRRYSDIKNKHYHEIIPVPLHKIRMRERGYNQSEEIANALSRILSIPMKCEHLLRIRSTSSQTKMTREEREQNIRDAFYCPEKMFERNILLIDDVITTGSTIEACIKVLRNAGVRTIDVLAIAHPLINSGNGL